MFSFKRNQVIITALVVMIAIAGYLSWSDNRQSEYAGILLDENGEVSALVSDSNLDNYDLYALTDEELSSVFSENTDIYSEYGASEVIDQQTSDYNFGEAVFVNTSMETSFFVQAKLEREQSRSKQKDLMKEMINNANLEKEKRAEAADVLLDIQKRIERETAAESMIEAKGFGEVYVRIDDETVDVVVSKQALTDAEIAQIEDIVKRKTGVEADKIRISTIKK